jgi:hypothetical protein
MSQGTCCYIRVHTNAAADCDMLCLQRDFYNTIFKIKHKLYTASGSAPPKEKFWVRTCSAEIGHNHIKNKQTEPCMCGCCSRYDVLVRRLTSLQTCLTKSNRFGFQLHCRSFLFFSGCGKNGKLRARKKGALGSAYQITPQKGRLKIMA